MYNIKFHYPKIRLIPFNVDKHSVPLYIQDLTRTVVKLIIVKGNQSNYIT